MKELIRKAIEFANHRGFNQHSVDHEKWIEEHEDEIKAEYLKCFNAGRLRQREQIEANTFGEYYKTLND